jgi:hypothetical protein
MADNDSPNPIIRQSSAIKPKIVDFIAHFRSIWCVGIALCLLMVVVTKLAAVVTNVYYFGLVWEAVLPLAQCAVFVLVATILLSRPAECETLLIAGLLFGVLGSIATVEWGIGYSDCGCVPGLRITPAFIAKCDLFVAIVSLLLILPFNKVRIAHLFSNALLRGKSFVPHAAGLLLVLVALSAFASTQLGLRTSLTKHLRIPATALSMKKPKPSDNVPEGWVSVVVPIYNRGDNAVRLLGMSQGCRVRCASVVPIELLPNSMEQMKFWLRFPEEAGNTVVWIKLFSDDVPGISTHFSFVAQR